VPLAAQGHAARSSFHIGVIVHRKKISVPKSYQVSSSADEARSPRRESHVDASAHIDNSDLQLPRGWINQTIYDAE